MQFWKRIFQRVPKPNAHIESAIKSLCHEPSAHNRLTLYRSLKNADLILAVKEVDNDNGQEWITSKTQQGKLVLLAFTSEEQLQKGIPESEFVVVSSQELFEKVLSQNYEAVVINPAGPWVGIPKDHIEKYFNTKAK